MLENPDDRARLIYLVVLGLGLLFMSLGGVGRNWGKVMRDLALWGLIFAMVVIAYGFRDVLRRELFPASMVQFDGGSIALGRGANGQFQADVLVNDYEVRFLVDTGASDIVLSRRDAENVGIDMENLRFSGRARTANGVVATAPVRLARLRFGDYEDENVPASVNSGDLDVSLLGMGYLNRFSRIEIAGDRMILHR